MSLKSTLSKMTFFSIYLMLAKGGAAWMSKLRRQDFRARLIEKYIAKKYFPAIKNMQTQPVIKNETDTIWQWWEPPRDGTPKLVTACIDSVERHKGTREHIILTEKNIHDYAELPGYIIDKHRDGNIGNAHFADLLRLELLHNHGGYWMDATVFMTGEIPKIIDDSDFFMFHTGNVGWSYAFIQNFFIRSNRGAFLLDAWRALAFDYWKHEPRAIDYMFMQLMFKALVMRNQTAQELYKEMPKITLEKIIQIPEKIQSVEMFDRDKWEEIKATSFFQKLSRHNAKDALAGSWVDVISNMEY